MNAYAYYAIHDKKNNLLYIHATNVLPAVIFPLIGVYILVGGN